MTEKEAILARHSVRAYQDRRIEADKVSSLQALIDEVNQEGNLHLQLIEDAGRTFSKLFNKAAGLGSAPSVIACVGPDDAALEARIGYYGEKVVLFAQTLGLNTCWVGMFNRNHICAEVGDGERLVIAIAVGYGATQGKPHKSKPAQQLSRAEKKRPEWFNRGVELALLAPTALNQQKFEICLNADDSVTFTNKGGPFSKVDMGIVRYHFEVGAQRGFEA